MRFIQKLPQGFSNETTTSNHLMRYAINEPEVLSNMAQLYGESVSPLSALMSKRGKVFTKSLDSNDATARSYKSVGSRRVEWNIKKMTNRIVNIVEDFVCEEYPYEPGKNQSEVFIYTDIDWISPRDVCELADNNTYVYFHSSKLPREVRAGVWEYKCKLVTKNREDYINPDLLKSGKDLSVAYNMYEEASETAYEKYTFGERTGTNLTIMRLKHSITGTAQAMASNNKYWVEHNGTHTWLEEQEVQMMKRWFEYREIQSILGRGTVDNDGRTLMTLEQSGIQVEAGDGLINQGDGIYKMPYNPETATDKTLETILANMAIESCSDSQEQEVAVIGGMGFINWFSRVCKIAAGWETKNVIVNADGTKGIDNDYSSFKFAGIKMYPLRWAYLDSMERAGRSYVDSNGIRLESYRGFFISLGDRGKSDPQIEFLALGDRSFKKGTVSGINKGGDMANSVDAEHTHILSETGIANRDLDGVAEIFVPRVNKNRFSTAIYRR